MTANNYKLSINGNTASSTIFEINGTSGTGLMSVTDSTSGSLLSVLNSSSDVIFAVNSNGVVQHNTVAFTGITAATTTVITITTTGSVIGFYIDYLCLETAGGTFRTGTLMVGASGSSSKITYSDASTPDAAGGTGTGGFYLEPSLSGNNVVVTAYITDSKTYNFKIAVRSL